MYVKSNSILVIVILSGWVGLVFLAFNYFNKEYFLSNKIYTSIKTKVLSESELEQSTSIPLKGVLVNTKYGLGNQLFYYASSYALSRSLRIPLLVPVTTADSREGNSSNSSYRDCKLRLHHLSLPKATYIQQQQMQNLTNVYSASCDMAQNVSLIPQNVLNSTKYFRSYWCFNGEFFAKFQEELKEIRVNLEDPSEGYLKWIDKIGGYDWPVAVHVRGGDIKSQYWAAPIDYFKDAMRRMKKEAPRGLTLAYFVFSDEIDFARKGLGGEGLFMELELPVYFVSGSFGVFGRLTGLEEFDLMIKCRSIVISSSTFSWWAAYLMKDDKNNKKIVIRPQFNTTRHRNEVGWNGKKAREYEILYPQEWIRMEA